MSVTLFLVRMIFFCVVSGMCVIVTMSMFVSVGVMVTEAIVMTMVAMSVAGSKKLVSSVVVGHVCECSVLDVAS